MKDISLHILDIVQNSIAANAGFITVQVLADKENDRLTIEITDNGAGMGKKFLGKVTSPFTTTRTTRKVGLGIPLFKAGAERTGGNFAISSETGRGTKVRAEYVLNHLDRPPLGDLPAVFHTLALCNPNINFKFEAVCGDNAFTCETAQIRDMLGGVPLTEPEVSKWMIEYLTEGIHEIFGGKFE